MVILTATKKSAKKLAKTAAKTAISCLMLLLLYGCAYPGTKPDLQTVTVMSDPVPASDEESEPVPVADAGPVRGDASDQSISDQAAGQPSSGENCYVIYVCGAVNCPGVYKVPAGSRVYEALEQAGGLRDDASETAVNQAELLTDGQMLQIPTAEEAQSQEQAEDEASDGLVNINTAGLEELKTLPGVGDAKAKSIIAYREKNGPFTDIEDLMNIEGIKSGVFAKLEGYIKVN